MDKQVIIGVNDIQVQSGKEAVQLEDIALWNEYGTETIPPRPAFREGSDAAIREQKKNIDAYLSNVFYQSMQKSTSQKQLDNLQYGILKRLGQAAVKQVKGIINSGSTVSNAPATVKHKGFNHPLYHKGTLLKNVNYSVEDID